MMRAVSLWQPWPWLIFRPDIRGALRPRYLKFSQFSKDVENRPRHWSYTGDIVLCSTQKIDPDIDSLRESIHRTMGIVLPETFDCGGIIGVVRVGAMVSSHPSPWFTGPFAWPLSEKRLIPFQPMAGSQGIFFLKPKHEKYVKSELAKLENSNR